MTDHKASTDQGGTPGAEQGGDRLSLRIKVLFSTGDLTTSVPLAIVMFFQLYFLTDVVGLPPGMASWAVIIGRLWDAVNDPLFGLISDRIRSRWGRRRVLLLFGAVPLGVSFAMMWLVPPWGDVALTVYYAVAFILFDTIFTAVHVGYNALTPEMTPDYDERTELTTYRMLFNLVASLGVAVAAPMIKNWALSQGMTLSQSYLLISGMFGGLGALPFLIMFFFVRERHQTPTTASPSIKEIAVTAWENIPFRFATGLYMLNWMTVDMVSLILPYFLTYWIAQGNLTAEMSLFGANISQDSVILGLMFITAIVALPFWNWFSKKTSKRKAYLYGMGFWMIVQLLLIVVQPGQTILILTLTILAGISISTAHVLPDAIFPDVIEWEELRTKKRNEGVYYGAKNFSRKMSGAITIFLVLQLLGWFGYQTPPEGATVFQQTDTTLLVIRILTGPFGAILLLCSIIIAWFYPLTREKHARIRKLLIRRENKKR